MSSPPTNWTPALGEMVLKIDGKFKVRPIYPQKKMLSRANNARG
jgi:hypothetical protein